MIWSRSRPLVKAQTIAPIPRLYWVLCEISNSTFTSPALLCVWKTLQSNGFIHHNRLRRWRHLIIYLNVAKFRVYRAPALSGSLRKSGWLKNTFGTSTRWFEQQMIKVRVQPRDRLKLMPRSRHRAKTTTPPTPRKKNENIDTHTHTNYSKSAQSRARRGVEDELGRLPTQPRCFSSTVWQQNVAGNTRR